MRTSPVPLCDKYTAVSGVCISAGPIGSKGLSAARLKSIWSFADCICVNCEVRSTRWCIGSIHLATHRRRVHLLDDPGRKNKQNRHIKISCYVRFPRFITTVTSFHDRRPLERTRQKRDVASDCAAGGSIYLFVALDCTKGTSMILANAVHMAVVSCLKRHAFA